MDGNNDWPKDTPYRNGFFTVEIYFLDDYPEHSPDIYTERQYIMSMLIIKSQAKIKLKN